MGLSQIRSTAFLIDIGGDDEYYLGKGTPGLGEATFRKGYDKPTNLTTYYSYASSFGGFIDIGGNDKYFHFDSTGQSQHPWADNNTQWFRPEKTDSLFGFNNFGVGIDVDSGTIPEFYRWE